MHFANIEQNDDLVDPQSPQGKNYVCIVQNGRLRSLVQGDDQQVKPVFKGVHFFHECQTPFRADFVFLCNT